MRHTGEAYRGINVLVLWATAHDRGYGSAHWLTYRQAQELGGQSGWFGIRAFEQSLEDGPLARS